MTNNTAIIYHKDYLEHKQAGLHPERKDRLIETMNLFKIKGVFNTADLLTPEPATDVDLQRVHTKKHIEHIKNMSTRGGGMLTPDTRVSKNTYEIAKLAAGGVMLAGDCVVCGKYKNSYALVRPPGHHATRDAGMGFCYFNNVSVMVEYLKEKHNLKKILILDWDAHAANGTMDIFYNDDGVLNISIHQDPRTFYPGTGFINQIGEGAGEGYTVNIPVSRGSGDADYIYILKTFVAGLAESFKPELIVISVGIDSHKDDDISELCLTTRGYGVMTDIVKELAEKLCDGKLVCELEGGYNLKALAESNLEIVNSLMGKQVPYAEVAGKPMAETIKLVNELKQIFSKYHNFNV